MVINKKKINKLFLYWLSISLLLVFFIIIIGGLTRLTDSGLSITEWELFKGVLPPLNNITWQMYFDQYKKIPQYNLLNFDMKLNEFKVIFYWEYFHRNLARLIGLFFLLPLLYFYFSKKINKKYIQVCMLIFLLIVFQGIVGWYMVKSGLVNDITVSHYRLSIHLFTGIIIISTIFWLLMNIIRNKNKIFFKFKKDNLPFLILFLLLFTQIIIGAFVSGLDAGRIYQTWPLMGNNFLPNDLSFDTYENFLEFNNHSLVQFYHRSLAYFITIYVLILTISIYKKKLFNLYNSVNVLIFFLFLQATLGILTLISDVNILLASAHQITSVLLVFSALNLYFLRTK